MKKSEVIKEINKLLKDTDIKYLGTKLRNKDNKVLKNEIIYFTKFLSEKATISERIYCIKNNITEIKKCPICKIKKLNYYNYHKGYGEYCSIQCMGKSEIVKKSREKTNINIYGSKTPSESLLVKNKIKETNIAKYGVDNPMKFRKIKDKVKQTNIKKYGENTPTKNINIKQKIKETNIEKYGVDNPMKYKAIKEKYIKTNTEKYGVSNPTKDNKIREKIKKTNYIKYNKEYYSQTDTYKKQRKIKMLLNRSNNLYKKYIEYLNENFYHNINKNSFVDKLLEGPYDIKCKKCGTLINDKFIYSFSNNRFCRCFKCNPILKSVSKYELEIFNHIKKIDKSCLIIKNDKEILDGKEIDIYIPDKNIGIEFNGLMFHSVGKSKYSMFNNYLSEFDLNKKHVNKTNKCLEKGVHLLHIFENEWKDEIKRNIWKSIIKTKLGYNDRIYGRKTYIKIVSNELSKDFLHNNHLQGNVGSSVKIGLFSKRKFLNKEGKKIIEKDELISIMTFGKSRYGNEKWEILRYANKLGLSVIGGASKIFKYFLDNHVLSGESIKTYADLRFSQGNVYKQLGFNFSHNSQPNYFYFKGNSYDLESRVKYQKHKLKNILENFDENLTESENMYNNGYRKIYDCGNAVFYYNK